MTQGRDKGALSCTGSPSVVRFGQSILLASTLATLVLWMTWLFFPEIGLRVDDVTASEITAAGYAKTSDFLIAAIATLTAAVSALATWRWADVMASGSDLSDRDRPTDGIVFVAVAVAVAVAAMAAPDDHLVLAFQLFSGVFNWGTFPDSVTVWAQVASTATAIWVTARLVKEAFHRRHLITTPHFWAAPILAFYVALLVGAAAALAVRGGMLPFGPSGSVVAASVTGVAALEWARRRPEATIARATSAAQLAIPLVLVLPLLRTVRIDGSAVLVGGAGPAIAALVVVALVAAAQSRALDRSPSPPLEWGQLVTPVTAGAVAVAAMAGFIPAPSGLAIGDSFHTGEQLVQWQQLSQHGRIPFVDFVPVPGGWPTLVGAVAAFLWESTVAGFGYATGLGLAAVAFICGVLLHGLVGPHWALPGAYTLAVFGLPQMDRFLLAAAYVLVLSWPRLLHRPVLWLLAWVPVSIIGVAAMPATVAPAVAASVPVAGWMAVTICRTRGRGHWTRSEAVAGSLLLALAVVTVPYGIVVADAVLHESSANATIWGLGLRVSREPLRLSFEAARTAGWTFGTATFVVLGQLLRARRGRNSHVFPSSSEVLVVLGLGYIFLSIPYAWGRISSHLTLSRPGQTTVFITVFMVTWALLSVPDRRIRRRVGGGWLLLMVAAVSIAGPFSPPAVLANASAAPEIDRTVRPPWSDTVGAGLGYYRVDVAEEVGRFQAILQELIPDGTYYDAVNRSALFAVTGRRIIGAYPSALYAASASAQRSLVDAFEATPPEAALIGPAQHLLVGPIELPFSLRSYRPYRWLIEQGYVGVSGGGYVFLVPDGRRNRILQSASDGSTGSPDLLLLPARDTAVADVIQPRELGMLAATWGASADAILSRMTPGVVLDGRPTPSGMRFELPALNEPVPDFLSVRLDCSVERAEARYRTSRGSEDWVVFEAVDGQHILPLGTDPRWLRTTNPAPRWIEVDVDAHAGCEVRPEGAVHRLAE